MEDLESIHCPTTTRLLPTRKLLPKSKPNGKRKKTKREQPQQQHPWELRISRIIVTIAIPAIRLQHPPTPQPLLLLHTKRSHPLPWNTCSACNSSLPFNVVNCCRLECASRFDSPPTSRNSHSSLPPRKNGSPGPLTKYPKKEPKLESSTMMDHTKLPSFQTRMSFWMNKLCNNNNKIILRVLVILQILPPVHRQPIHKTRVTKQ